MRVRDGGLVALSMVVAMACGQPPGDRHDAGDDAGAVDAGADAGLTDAGVDAGPPDASTEPFDAGPFRARFVGPDGGELARVVYSEPFSIEVHGAAPGAAVHLRLKTSTQLGLASFLADSKGSVRTAGDAPIAGQYTGVDPEGLLWAAEPSPSGQARDLNLALEVESNARTTQVTLVRDFMGTGYRYGTVDAGGLPGVLFVKADGGVQPALLVLGGSECDLNSTVFMAAWFTTMGVDALAVDYCRGKRVRDVPLEGLGRALEFLAAQPGVDARKLGVAGGSRGGELALQLAADEPRLKAAVALVPSSYRWADTDDGTHPAWTRNDAGLPYLSGGLDGTVLERLPNGATAYRTTGSYPLALDASTPELRAASRIGIGDAGASILFIGGSDDGVWPSCDFSREGMAWLEASGHRAGHPLDRALCLPDAGHLVGPPGLSSLEGYAATSPSGFVLVTGGTPVGRGQGNRKADTAIREFLQEAFR